jgi:hypothetical protein
VRGLEAQLAVRHDYYSDFGGTTESEGGGTLAANRGVARSRFLRDWIPRAYAARPVDLDVAAEHDGAT